MKDVVAGRVVLGWIPVGTTFPASVEVPAMQGMTSLWPEGTAILGFAQSMHPDYVAVLGMVISSVHFDLEWTQNLQRFLVQSYDCFKRNENVT